MAVLDTDLLMIERSGTLYKTPVSALPSGGGGGGGGRVLLATAEITSDVEAVTITGLSLTTYSKLVVEVAGVAAVPYTTGQLECVLSTDGGSTWIVTGYTGVYTIIEGTAVSLLGNTTSLKFSRPDYSTSDPNKGAFANITITAGSMESFNRSYGYNSGVFYKHFLETRGYSIAENPAGSSTDALQIRSTSSDDLTDGIIHVFGVP